MKIFILPISFVLYFHEIGSLAAIQTSLPIIFEHYVDMVVTANLFGIGLI